MKEPEDNHSRTLNEAQLESSKINLVELRYEIKNVKIRNIFGASSLVCVVMGIGGLYNQNYPLLENPYNNTPQVQRYEQLARADQDLDRMMGFVDVSEPDADRSWGETVVRNIFPRHQKVNQELESLTATPPVQDYLHWNNRYKKTSAIVTYAGVIAGLLGMAGSGAKLIYNSRKKRREISDIKKTVEISSPSP